MDIGTLVMKINADASNAQKGIDGFKKTIGGLGKAAGIAGGAIAAGIGVALVDGIKGMSKMQDQTAQLEAVLKSTGGAAGVTAKDVTDMADALEKTTKFTAESTIAASNLLLTFTNIGKDVFPQATKTALDMAQALGTDAAGQSIALGKALNDPVAGITALTRVGVTFSEEQKNTIKTMVEMGDVAGAQTVILNELSKEFGGSAEAAGKTFSGQIEIAKNAVGAITESLASGLMPVLQGALDWIIRHMPEIQSFFETAFSVIGDAINFVVDIFNTYLLPVLTTFFDWLSSNMPAIQETFSNVFKTIVAVATEVWKFFKDNILPVYIDFYNFIVSNFPIIQNIFKNVFGIIADVVGVAWNVLTGLFDFIKPTFPIIGAIIKTEMQVVINIINGVIGVIRTLVGWIKQAIDWLSQLNVTQAGSQVGSLQSGLTAGLSGQISGQRAFGGSVMAGSSYLVGERGPELFTPGTNGKISSGGNNITINVNGANDPQMVGNEIVRILQSQGIK